MNLFKVYTVYIRNSRISTIPIRLMIDQSSYLFILRPKYGSQLLPFQEKLEAILESRVSECVAEFR